METMSGRQIENRQKNAKKYLDYLFKGHDQSAARGELAITEIETNDEIAEKHFAKQKSKFIKGINSCLIFMIIKFYLSIFIIHNTIGILFVSMVIQFTYLYLSYYVLIFSSSIRCIIFLR